MKQWNSGPAGSWPFSQRLLRDWYDTAVGRELHALITARVEHWLRDRYALHCLQIGGTCRGVDLFSGRGLVHRLHVSGDENDSLRACPAALPLASGSIDLVILCHALEFGGQPHALLREIDRVLTLDGRVVVVAFNPWSLYGARAAFGRRRAPWCGRFYSPARLGDWLGVLGWRIQQRDTLGFGLPVQRARLRLPEAAGRWLPWQGAVQLLFARKHSIPLNPLPAQRVRARKPAVIGTIRPTTRMENAA